MSLSLDILRWILMNLPLDIMRRILMDLPLAMGAEPVAMAAHVLDRLLYAMRPGAVALPRHGRMGPLPSAFLTRLAPRDAALFAARGAGCRGCEPV